MAAPPANRNAVSLWSSGALLVASVAVWALLVFSAPIDSMQGVIQKVLLVEHHEPIVGDSIERLTRRPSPRRS